MKSVDQNIYIGNNTYSDVINIGFYRINMRGNNILLKDVLFVYSIRINLVSVTAVIAKGFPDKITAEKYEMNMFEGQYVKKHKMFKINKSIKASSSIYIDCALIADVNLWYERLGHTSLNKIKK